MYQHSKDDFSTSFDSQGQEQALNTFSKRQRTPFSSQSNPDRSYSTLFRILPLKADNTFQLDFSCSSRSYSLGACTHVFLTAPVCIRPLRKCDPWSDICNLDKHHSCWLSTKPNLSDCISSDTPSCIFLNILYYGNVLLAGQWPTQIILLLPVVLHKNTRLLFMLVFWDSLLSSYFSYFQSSSVLVRL